MYNKTNIKEISKDKYDEINSSILARGASNSKEVFSAAYLGLMCSEEGISNVVDLENYISNLSDNRKMFLKHMVRDFSLPISIAETHDKDTLISFLSSYFEKSDMYLGKNDLISTPYGLAKLSNKILDIQDSDKVADFGCGVGTFFMYTDEKNENTPYYGIEIETFSKEIAAIRCELFLENAEIEQGDMFLIDKNKKFDKIFSNYPFGMRLRSLQEGSKYLEELYSRVPDMKKVTSSDWVFNTLLLDHLNDNGKAVGIMTNGSCWNTMDYSIRKYFVDNGYIEAVISLPGRLFNSTGIAVSMIVISKGNSNIRMVDASELCLHGRRLNEITDENVEEIYQLLKSDSEISTVVDLKQFEENEYALNPQRYLEKEIEIEDGIEFGKLMKRITRGAPLKASELDSMISKEPTDTQYLMLANIQNGMISDDLPYLEELDSKFDKYCIGNGNLLMSKNGSPFKVAVAEVEEGKKILGNGNLFIIQLDEEKVNPYYLKAFFDSELGIISLQKITVGATIPNISAESLKKMLVPLPAMEKQLEIARRYQAKMDEIKILNIKLKKAQSELKNIFGEE